MKLNEINTETVEGRMLLAAIAVLSQTYEFTGTTPDGIMKLVEKTANHINSFILAQDNALINGESKEEPYGLFATHANALKVERTKHHDLTDAARYGIEGQKQLKSKFSAID